MRETVSKGLAMVGTNQRFLALAHTFGLAGRDQKAPGEIARKLQTSVSRVESKLCEEGKADLAAVLAWMQAGKQNVPSEQPSEEADEEERELDEIANVCRPGSSRIARRMKRTFQALAC